MLACVFIIPAIFFAVGCGNDVDATGKTYEVIAEGYSCVVTYPDGFDQDLKEGIEDALEESEYISAENDFEGNIIKFKEDNKGEISDQGETINFTWAQKGNKVTFSINMIIFNMDFTATINGSDVTVEAKVDVSAMVGEMVENCPDGIYVVTTFKAKEV